MSSIWKEIKQLRDALKVPILVKWPSTKIKFKEELARLKSLQRSEEKSPINEKKTTRYVRNPTHIYLVSYDIMFNFDVSHKGVTDTIAYLENASSEELLRLSKENKDYDAEITNFKIIKVDKIKNIKRNELSLKKGSFGNHLLYPDIGTLKTESENDECVYECFQTKYKISKQNIKDLIGKDFQDGLNLDDIEKICDYYNIGIYIVDQLGIDILIKKNDRTKKGIRKPEVFIMANEHLYMVDEKHRKLYINRYKNKNKDKIITYHDVSREEKKGKKSKTPKKRDIITLKEFPDIVKDIKENQWIFVEKDNLYEDYVKLLTLGLCYSSNLTNSKTITQIFLKEKNTIIYANANYKKIEKYIKKFTGLKFRSQTMPTLAKQYFNLIKSSTDKKWEYSYFNQQVEKIVYGINYGGKNFTKDYIHSDYKSNRIQEIDYYRCYTSIAMEGNFYHVNIDNDLKPYNGIFDKEHIYWVETEDKELFYKNGLYDYKVVEMGLKYNVISHKDIKYSLSITHSPNNDEIIKAYMKNVYANKSVLPKHTEDSLNKQMCNFLIGQLGAKYKNSYKKRYLTNSLSDAFCYYTELQEEHGNVSIKSIMSKEATIEELLKGSFDHEKHFYYVSSVDKKTLFGNNLLIRNAIVQRATAKVYETKMNIEKSGGKIIRVKTDAITYSINTRLHKAYPVPSKPTFGTLRKQKYKSINNDIFREQNNLNLSDNEPLEMMNNDWIDRSDECKINSVDYFDYKKILNYKRLFIKGFAGSGKSYTIRKLYDELIEKNIKVVKLCFTNTAANNIDGLTIHKFFGIGGEVDKFDSVIENIDVIILDEISMIPRNLWSIITKIPKNIKLYGFGDFRQLKPVEPEVKINIDYENCSFIKQIFNNNMIILKKQCRSDVVFANLCVDYHDKKISFDDLGLKIYSEKVLDADNLPDYNICRTNKKRRHINDLLMNKYAQIRDNPNDLIKSNEYRFTEFTHIYPEMPVIYIKPKVDKNKKDKLSKNEKTILSELVNNQKLIVKEVDNISVNVSYKSSTYFIPRDLFLRVFKPAYACTIHKSQGDTIDTYYGIHEFHYTYGDYMKSRYTSLTRSTDKKYIKIYK